MDLIPSRKAIYKDRLKVILKTNKIAICMLDKKIIISFFLISKINIIIKNNLIFILTEINSI